MNKLISIRTAKKDDIEKLNEVFEFARQIMISNNNPTQWSTFHPSKKFLLEDIQLGILYVVEFENKICGAFALVFGEDEPYKHIIGKRIDDSPYITIHSLASNGKIRDLFGVVLEYAKSFNHHIRIDTHRNNATMLHLMDKYGFVRTGLCYVDMPFDNERITFELVDKNESRQLN
jgi:hypothetical protein